MILIKNILQLFLAFFLINCNSGSQAINAKKNDAIESHPTSKIELTIEKGQKDGFLMFKLKNNEEKVFLAGPVASGKNNKFILFQDGGGSFEHYSRKKIKFIEIKSGETKTWSINMRPFLERYASKKNKAITQLVWSVNGEESAPFILNQ